MMRLLVILLVLVGVRRFNMIDAWTALGVIVLISRGEWLTAGVMLGIGIGISVVIEVVLVDMEKWD